MTEIAPASPPITAIPLAGARRPRLVFAREPLARWLSEAAPLFEAHWVEVGHDRDKIKLAPDWERWTMLERAGAVQGYTARVAAPVAADAQASGKGALAGYAGFLLAPHLHYRDHRFAYADVLYLAPEYRRGGAAAELIRFCERDLIASGCSKIIYHTKLEHSISRLLERLGYRGREMLHDKLVI